MKYLGSVCALLLLASCAGFGQPDTEPTAASCDKYPSQQNVAEHNFCQKRGQGGG